MEDDITEIALTRTELVDQLDAWVRKFAERYRADLDEMCSAWIGVVGRNLAAFDRDGEAQWEGPIWRRVPAMSDTQRGYPE